ncbi:RP-S7 [Acanthosepion pharaonis]|uniref:RP-S7 n=1 Tax=Acanthosepion pharaonis TaxID=158019 RepID=A0A812DFJ9_ACAPH|nr:RP-S7 [Sepia pharaonis]
MANVKVLCFVLTAGKPLTCSLFRHIVVLNRGSMWSPRYLNPTLSKEELAQELDEIDARKYQPIKAAQNNQTTSIFYNPTIVKFTNMIMKDGKKQVAVSIVDKMLANIKTVQILKYHSASDIESWNCIKSFYKGGVRYNVPIACTESKQTFLAMKWIISSCRDKERRIPVSEKLATEILAAYKNEGRSIHKKQDLHKQCEANKAFAHFRW